MGERTAGAATFLAGSGRALLAALAVAAAVALGAGSVLAATIDCPEGAGCTGTRRDDTIRGDFENTLRGRGGDDELSTARGRSDLFGDDGNDTLRALAPANHLEGGRGNDKIVIAAGAGFNNVYGDGGNDEIRALAGQNLIKGAGGDDRIDAQNGDEDTIDCGPGKDAVAFDAGLDNVTGCEGKL